MGTKISVSSVTINLGNEDVNAGRYDALIYALFQGISVTRATIESNFKGMGLKVQAAYNYARDHYTLGLPEGNDGTSTDGTFMPVVPLRYHNVDLTTGARRDTPLYATSKRLLKKLSIDIDQLGASISANPDIAEIDHAYVMFGVELQTKNNESIRYLNEYFHHVAQESKYNVYDFLAHAAMRVAGEQNTYDFMVDPSTSGEGVSLTEHGLNVGIRYTFINSRVVSGVIGPVGKATSDTYIGQTAIYTVKEQTPEEAAWTYDTYGWYANTDPETTVQYVDGSHITLRLQLTDTTYREVKVYGLVHINNIYAGRYFSTSLAESLDPKNHNFIIPIHYGVASKFSLTKRNILYKDSLRLVINSYVETKVRWYQTGWFRLIMIVIAIVIIYFSWGELTPLVMDALAALEVSVTALLIYLVTVIMPKVLIGIIVGYIMRLVVDWVGPELGAIIGVVLAAYAIATGNINAGINYFTGMTTAQMCIAASSSILQASNTAINNSIDAVQEEMSLFASESEIKWDALESATDLLDTKSTLDPVTLLTTPPKKIILNESPTDFYDRTIHIGNVGVVALDMATHYYDIMLRLPKPQYS